MTGNNRAVLAAYQAIAYLVDDYPLLGAYMPALGPFRPLVSAMREFVEAETEDAILKSAELLARQGQEFRAVGFHGKANWSNLSPFFSLEYLDLPSFSYPQSGDEAWKNHEEIMARHNSKDLICLVNCRPE